MLYRDLRTYAKCFYRIIDRKTERANLCFQFPFQEYVFHLEPGKEDSGKGKCPYDPKLDSVSTLISKAFQRFKTVETYFHLGEQPYFAVFFTICSNLQILPAVFYFYFFRRLIAQLLPQKSDWLFLRALETNWHFLMRWYISRVSDNYIELNGEITALMVVFIGKVQDFWVTHNGELRWQ